MANDIIDVVQPHMEEIIKRKPADAEVAEKEDLVSHAMFEYYTRLYADYPEYSKTQYMSNVAEKFGRTPEEIEAIYTKFRWFSRAKQVLLKERDLSALPKDGTEALHQLLSNTNLIATLGTRFVTDYLANVNPQLMTPKDVYKIGMLVVECVRLNNEVNGGTTDGQKQGQVINLVIND